MDRKQLARVILSPFERRLGFGQDLFVEFHDREATLFRLVPDDDIRRRIRGDMEGPFWEPIGRLTEMMGKEIHGAVTGATRALDVGFAAELGAILIRQMAATPEFPINLAGRRESRFRTAYARFARKTAHFGGRIETCLSALIKNMREFLPADHGHKYETGLRFHAVDRQITVTPFQRIPNQPAGEPLSLRQFVDRISGTPEAGRLAEEISRNTQLVNDSIQFGEIALGRMSVEFADALAKCDQERRIVGLPLCSSARIRGIPAQVALYIDPATRERSRGTVSLVVRRAHEEFVLQNSAGELFYFPPIQLVASLLVQSHNYNWTLAKPRVRMPARQPRWLHPYTSNLDLYSIDSQAIMLRKPVEPMFAASADAKRMVQAMFPFSDQPLSSDFCLQDQGPRVYAAEERLRQSLAADDEPDVLTAVKDVWDLARFGLTSAHQMNVRGPRVNLCTEAMPYPIKNSREFRKSALARRLFPFDPRKPLKLRR